MLASNDVWNNICYPSSILSYPIFCNFVFNFIILLYFIDETNFIGWIFAMDKRQKDKKCNLLFAGDL